MRNIIIACVEAEQLAFEKCLTFFYFHPFGLPAPTSYIFFVPAPFKNTRLRLSNTDDLDALYLVVFIPLKLMIVFKVSVFYPKLTFIDVSYHRKEILPLATLNPILKRL